MAAVSSSSLSKKTIPSAYFVIFVTTMLSLPPSRQTFRPFKSIISFGDSLTDTGNLARRDPPPPSALENFLRLPYGETFFSHPTGRWSDGRLVVDFMAQEFGLPFAPPFLGSCIVSDAAGCASDFQQGMNFAMAGATALDKEFFDKQGVQIPFPNASLVDQLSWFRQQFLPIVCTEPHECETYLKNTLFLVGEIGGNDYNHALFNAQKTLDLVQEFVPDVVKAIGSAVTELIELGARTLMVPGNFPVGCTSKFLTAYQTSDKSQYDPETGCLNWANEFSQYHNRALQSELSSIQRQNPTVTIIYADNYAASMHLYRHPTRYGFSKEGALYSCCGGEGPYNVSLSVNCGNPGSYTCPDPSLYVCWDGLHYTEAANRHITRILLLEYFANGDRSLSF